VREAGVIPTLAPYKCRPVQTLLVPLCARMIQAHPFGIKARREPLDLGGDLGKLGSEPHPGLLGSAKPVTGSDAGTDGARVRICSASRYRYSINKEPLTSEDV